VTSTAAAANGGGKKKRPRKRLLKVGQNAHQDYDKVLESGIIAHEGGDGIEGMYVAQTKDDSQPSYSVAEKLRMVRLQEVETPPDGNCGFWAVLYMMGVVRCRASQMLCSQLCVSRCILQRHIFEKPS